MPDTENIINVEFQKAEQDKLPGVEKVYQIKITLNDLRPPFWRRLQIPAGITFMKLHLILQEALGWENAHLFAFRFRHTEVGMKMDDFMGFGGQESIDAQETIIDEMLESEKSVSMSMISGMVGTINWCWRKSCLRNQASNIPFVWRDAAAARRRILAACGAMTRFCRRFPTHPIRSMTRCWNGPRATPKGCSILRRLT